MRPVALLTRQWPEEPHRRLTGRCEARYLMPGADLDADFFRTSNRDVQVLVTSFLDADGPELFAALPALALIAHVGPCRAADRFPADVDLCDTGDAGCREAAEHALTLMLSAARRLGTPAAATGGERPLDRNLGHSLIGGTVGFLGFDATALWLARHLRALDVECICFLPEASREAVTEADAAGVMRLPAAADVAERADAMSVHGRGRDALVTRGVLAQCRAHTVIVNVTDASLIDETALVDALRERRIGGVGLDVCHDAEAIGACPNALVTPHLATSTPRARLEMTHRAVDNIEAWLNRGEAIDLVRR